MSKMEKFSGQPPPQTPLPWGGGHPLPTPHSLDPRAYGARPRPQGRLPRVLWAASDAPAGPQASHQLNPALSVFMLYIRRASFSFVLWTDSAIAS